MSDTVRKFLSGTFWTTSESVIFNILNILQLAITSRYLTKIDFGIYAIVLFFSTLGTTVFSMGFSAALIQKKGDVYKYLNTSWSTGILVAVIASLLLSLACPIICNFYYHNNEAIYPSLAIILCLFVTPLANPAVILLLKEIKLKRYFYLRVIPKLLSFILVVFFALTIRSYWALVVALLVEEISRTIYSYYLVPYKPKFHFDKSQFVELYSFGGWLQLKNICHWFVSNIDTAIVGNILNTSLLGQYNRARSISNIPSTLVNNVINSVAFPLYSQMQDDKIKLSKTINEILNIVLMAVGLIVLVVLLFGGNLINLVLGPNWEEISLVFKILIIAISVQSLLFSLNPIMRAYGYTNLEFMFYVISIFLMILFMYPMTKIWKLDGTAYSILFSVLISVPIMMAVIKKKIQISFFEFTFNTLMTIIQITVCYFICKYFLSFQFWGYYTWIFNCFLAIILFGVLVFICGYFNIGAGKNIPLLLALLNRKTK